MRRLCPFHCEVRQDGPVTWTPCWTPVSPLPHTAAAVVAQLGLDLRGVNRAILADGRDTTLDVYGVTVLWDGQARGVVAYASDTTPLIGMSLLHRHNRNVDIEDGGRVPIQAKAQAATG